MKNMNLLILFILLSSIVFLIFIFNQSNKKIKIEQQWKKLVTSDSPETERESVQELVNTVTKLDGSWMVNAVTNDNSLVNLMDNSIPDEIKSVNVTFYWGKHQFEGKNWVPKDKDNIYEFFRDK